MAFYQDPDALETQEWQDAFDSVISHVGLERAAFLLKALYQQAIARQSLDQYFAHMRFVVDDEYANFVV